MLHDDIIRIPAGKCLHCGHRLDAIGADRRQRPPGPGDPIACLRCGAAMTIGEDGSLRGFTGAEMDALTADTEAMNELARVVRKIHFITHAMN